jgi:hypothetical protein
MVAVAVTAMAAYSFAEMPPLEFKGLHPAGDGTPLLTHGAWTCAADQLNGSDTVCSRKHETIAGADTNLVMVGLKDGKILSIYVFFSQNDFTRVHEALVLKYGPPQKGRVDTKTNRMGAEFASRVSEWRKQSKHMRLEERSGRLDQSTLHISSDEATRAAADHQKNRAGKNKSDL